MALPALRSSRSHRESVFKNDVADVARLRWPEFWQIELRKSDDPNSTCSSCLAHRQLSRDGRGSQQGIAAAFVLA
ncbi:hypothetical protein RSSM_04704 [Rhodopirellula sallentina SM41]|uniref:Uncharacterized protein n=1 Tax=Rhodopirellula sallentina SM41 TaxID=1263870 RepID=M5UCW7_9BACT|nr:hypothetical protein RSSM_04704 [Rhodopirellula sallentina SM41]